MSTSKSKRKDNGSEGKVIHLSKEDQAIVNYHRGNMGRLQAEYEAEQRTLSCLWQGFIGKYSLPEKFQYNAQAGIVYTGTAPSVATKEAKP